MNILVTDAEYKHSLGIVRRLGIDGYEVYALAKKKYSLCGLSRYCADELVLEEFNIETLIQLCHKNNIQFIILVGTNSFQNIVPYKDELEKNRIFMTTVTQEQLNIAFSKKETYLLAENLDLPIAKTFYPKSIDELEKLKKQITYPCVIKGLYEVGGNIVDYAYSENELIEKYIAICTQYNLESPNELPMLQEYITGSGCAFFAVYDHGQCGLTFQHKRIREFPVSGGASVCAESYSNHLVKEYGKKLLDSLKWHGVAMVEFKLNKDGIPILMEINPKFWGSTDLALEAGVNFPKALVDIYEKKEVEYAENYSMPFRYHWPLHGDIIHGIKNPKNFKSVIVDCLNPSVKSNIWLSDFLPTINMFYGFIKQFVRVLI